MKVTTDIPAPSKPVVIEELDEHGLVPHSGEYAEFKKSLDDTLPRAPDEKQLARCRPIPPAIEDLVYRLLDAAGPDVVLELVREGATARVMKLVRQRAGFAEAGRIVKALE